MKVISVIVADLALFFLFFGLFFPLSLVARLFNYDPLRLRLAPNAKTYWKIYNNGSM